MVAGLRRLLLPKLLSLPVETFQPPSSRIFSGILYWQSTPHTSIDKALLYASTATYGTAAGSPSSPGRSSGRGFSCDAALGSVERRFEELPVVTFGSHGTCIEGITQVSTYVPQSSHKDAMLGVIPFGRNTPFGIRNCRNPPSEIRTDKLFALWRSCRGVSSSSTMGHLQKQVKLRVYLQSPGVILEPYRPPEPLGPFFQRWFTRDGWAKRRKRIMDAVKTGFALARLRQMNRGYTRNAFYAEAVSLYTQINHALAKGDRSALRQLVTEAEFTNMKRELKVREEAGWAAVDWAVELPVDSVSTLQARLIAVDKDKKDDLFVQLTLAICSTQTFAAYDQQKRLVAGDPHKKMRVKDLWVLERWLVEKDFRWRLAGRLPVMA